MKIIFLTITIYAYACVCVLGASTAKEYRTKPRRGIEDVIAEKCLENSHDKNSFVNLNEAVNNYIQCQTRTVYRDHQDPPHPVEQHNEFCKYFEESGFYPCMENLASAVVPCLDKREIFFPDMILKAYNTTFNKLCGTNGLSYTEYIFNIMQDNRECFNNASRIISSRSGCVRNLIAYKNFNNKIVDLNQHDYCIDMKSFLNCATEIIELQCDQSFGIIKSYISDLFLGVCEKPKRPNWFVSF